MSIRTRRRLAALVLGAGVLLAGGCMNGDYHGRAYYGQPYYGSGAYVGYNHQGCSGTGEGYGALILLGIYGVAALIRAICGCD